MALNLRAILGLTCLFAVVGCASSNQQKSLAGQGWTKLGKVTIKAEQDQSVVRAISLPGKYRNICLESNGPALIQRFAITFADSTTFQTQDQLAFDGPGQHIIQFPGGERQLMSVLLSYSGGKLVMGTTVILWVR